MTTFTPAMSILLPATPPPPYPQDTAFGAPARLSANLDGLSLSQSFWSAVALDTPKYLHGSLVDEKTAVRSSAVEVSIQEATVPAFDNDPIVAFETLDCYSPNRPTFSPAPSYDYDELDVLETNGFVPASERSVTQQIPAGLSIALDSIAKSTSHQETLPPTRQSSPWSSRTFLRKPSSTKGSPRSLSLRHQASITALTASFLNSIGKLTRSRSSTPSNTSEPAQTARYLPSSVQPAQPSPAFGIFDSEVMINVIEDGKRAGVCEGQSLCSEFDRALERLHLEPFPDYHESDEDEEVARGRRVMIEHEFPS